MGAELLLDQRCFVVQITTNPRAYSVAHASKVVEVQPQGHAAKVGEFEMSGQ